MKPILIAGLLLALISAQAGPKASFAANKKAATPASATNSSAKTSPSMQKYLEEIKSRIQYYWQPAKSKTDDGYVTLRFRLHKNGQISWVELTDASGVEAVNQAAEDAVTRALPFPALPASAGNCIDLCVDFSSAYSPQNRIAYARPVGFAQAQKQLTNAKELQSKKDYEGAIQWLNTAHELSPFDKRITDALVECKIAQSKKASPEASISMMHECLLLQSNNQVARDKLNDLLNSAGVKAGDAQARIDLARTCASKGAFDDAISEYGEAWLLKKDPQLIAEINSCLQKRKSYSAVKKWSSVLKAADTIDNHIALAQAYESCGLKDNALDEYRLVQKKSAENKTARASLKRLLPSEKFDWEAEDEIEKEEADGEKSENDMAEKTIRAAMTATDASSSKSDNLSASAEQISDDFPYLNPVSCKLKMKLLANRQPIVDYLKDASPRNTLIRWASNRIPLSVFIDSGAGVPGYRPQFRQHLIDAFSAWQAGSDGRIRYQLVSGPTGANIICHWTADPKDKRMTGREQGITYFKYLQSDPYSGMVQSAEITILIKDRMRFQVLSDPAMKAVCIHELGHSLGIAGHSPVRTDIMFPSITINGYFPSALSERDKATIRRLYQAYSHPRS